MTAAKRVDYRGSTSLRTLPRSSVFDYENYGEDRDENEKNDGVMSDMCYTNTKKAKISIRQTNGGK